MRAHSISKWKALIKRVHGNKIELLKFVGNGQEKSKFRCSKGHTWFAPLDSVVHHASGCSKCNLGGRPNFGLSGWKKRIKKVHGDEIELLEYGGDALKKSKFRCSEGHIWTTTVSSIVYGGWGCKTCSDARSRYSISEWKKQIKAAHGAEIELLEFGGNARIKSKLRCLAGHVWFAALSSITRGVGCPECFNVRRRFNRLLPVRVVDARLKSKNIKRIGKYINDRTATKLQCLVCDNEWKATLDAYMHSTTGCPTCNSIGRYSPIATKWLESEAKQRRIVIKHIKNGGEYVIPGTRLRVDGFHKKSKTVFEFYGDCWHGNPAIYAPDEKSHPWSDMTARQLYLKTKAREKRLRNLGYRVITMWESDFKKMSA